MVTSGTFSPSLERGIGMAYLPAERAEPGTRIEIDVRGSVRPATVVKKPIYFQGALTRGRGELSRGSALSL